MTLLNKRNYIIFFSAFTLIFNARSQENLLDYKNSLEFARYLTSTRQYSFAMEEYERLNFLWPGDTTICFELIRAYRYNKQCLRLDDAFDLIRKNIYQNNSLASVREYLTFSLTCRALPDMFNEISILLKPQERSFYELSFFWVTEEHNSAVIYCHENENLLNRFKPDLYKLTLDFENEKCKSPGLAVMLSAALPGAGKAYSKRWGDALVSFLFTGINAYSAYRAFDKKGIKSVNGWVFGSIAFSFYSANLWGSAKAAKSYNSNLRIRYQTDAENIIYNSF